MSEEIITLLGVGGIMIGIVLIIIVGFIFIGKFPYLLYKEFLIPAGIVFVISFLFAIFKMNLIIVIASALIYSTYLQSIIIFDALLVICFIAWGLVWFFKENSVGYWDENGKYHNWK